MVDVANAELKAAEARGRRILITEPRASSARFNRATVRVVIDSTNGCTYAFPTRLVKDLQGAGAVQSRSSSSRRPRIGSALAHIGLTSMCRNWCPAFSARGRFRFRFEVHFHKCQFMAGRIGPVWICARMGSLP
jgi:hypothetical protein